MRVTIYGAGALGCYFGARLQECGHDVTFVARGAHLEAMQSNGLLIENPAGDIRLETVQAVGSIGEAGGADVVLFAVKNYDVVEAAADLAEAIGPDTYVITVQNGVSAQSQLAEAIGQENVWPGVVRMPADIKAPGIVRASTAAGMGGLVFGTYDGTESHEAQETLEAFKESGVNAALSDDIWRSLWEKFIPLSAFAASTVMARLDIGAVRDNPASLELLKDLVDETTAVARAEHSSVPEEVAQKAMAFLTSVPPNTHASMLDDLLRGRRIELEWLSGEVVRRGTKLGIATPAHAFAYAVLAPYVSGRPDGAH